jgi:predicted ribosomally synthesized peptide with SipW-like signal peptide
MASPLIAGGNGRRVVATLGVLGAIGALATVGTYSLFTDSVVGGPQTVATGTVDIAFGGTNTLATGATDVAPGDSMQRVVDLTNSGSIAFASVTLDVAATTSSLLDTDTTDGLQMAIDSCSVPWTPSGAAYTCGGTTTALVASRPVVGTGIALPGVAALAPAGTDRLRVTLSLPTTAGNSFQNLSSTLQYTFTATQRAGTAK